MTRAAIGATLLALILAAAFWRYVWFFRDPLRTPPTTAGILSPADGRVVYVRRVPNDEDVVVIKQGVRARVRDLLREDSVGERLVIGVFMSPLDVHYNRAPLSGRVRFVRHHPPRGRNLHMGRMHARLLLGWRPYYAGSRHIVENERTVTCISGELAGRPLQVYVIQIGAMAVRGIDSYVQAGDLVERGQTFGMIRIGSQVDLVLSWRDSLTPMVAPGDRVRAGESVLVC